MIPPDMVRGRLHTVNPQTWRAAITALLLAGLAAGCGTFSNYPMGMDQTVLRPLRAGKKTGYAKTFADRTEGANGVLFALEKGRVAQLEGDYSISRAAFASAFEQIRAKDEKAVVSASGAAAQGGAVLVNDKAIPYRAPDYERTLAHHYQALNYLVTNDLTGAGVEIRRANREQEAARKRHEAEIDRARSDEENVSPDDERDPSMLAVYAGLDEMAGSVKDSFQNAATFYLSAVVWEMLGEANDAYIDCKKALEIVPENIYLQMDAVRLAKRLGMREDLADLKRRFPRASKMPAADSAALAGKARLVVFYEEGLAPQKSELSVAYPLPSAHSIGVVALPMYEQSPPPAVPVEVCLDGVRLARTAPVCSIAALAARSLAERMPGILTRQVARAVTKGVAAKAAKDSGGGWAELAVLLYNVASEQADLRSWLTLPAHIQILSAWIEPGRQAVSLAAPQGGVLWSGEVTLEAGETTLVYVTRIDLAVFSHVMVQP